MTVTAMPQKQIEFSVLDAGELEKLSNETAASFSGKAEVSYQKQSEFSCYASELIELAIESIKQGDDMKVEALLISIRHLISSWDSELATFAGLHEAVIKKLHTAESIALGEAA